MNKIRTICFQTRGGVNRNYGGLDRVTEILADYFEQKGYTVFYLSQVKRPNTDDERQYYLPNEWKLKTSENIVFYNSFIKDKGVDVLINQEGNVNLVLPLEGINKNIIYITALHFNPNYITENHFVHKFSKMNIPVIAKRVLTSFFEISLIKKKSLSYLHRKLENNYHFNCRNCDMFVLLSDKFKCDLNKLFLKYDIPTNVTAIHNPIQLNQNIIDFSNKKKKLLYVGRLESGMKQIDKLLKIWGNISNAHLDWSFHLVGGGPDESILKKQVIDEAIPRVIFEGIQNPKRFYEESSIFCFSSNSSEGWGMVLVEAQTYGCVPIAFNTYSAITDIITDNENGCLIPPYDTELYQQSLSELMNNINERQRLAERGKESVERFEINKIGREWLALFEKIALQKDKV